MVRKKQQQQQEHKKQLDQANAELLKVKAQLAAANKQAKQGVAGSAPGPGAPAAGDMEVDQGLEDHKAADKAIATARAHLRQLRNVDPPLPETDAAIAAQQAKLDGLLLAKRTGRPLDQQLATNAAYVEAQRKEAEDRRKKNAALRIILQEMQAELNSGEAAEKEHDDAVRRGEAERAELLRKRAAEAEQVATAGSPAAELASCLTQGREAFDLLCSLAGINPAAAAAIAAARQVFNEQAAPAPAPAPAPVHVPAPAPVPVPVPVPAPAPVQVAAGSAQGPGSSEAVATPVPADPPGTGPSEQKGDQAAELAAAAAAAAAVDAAGAEAPPTTGDGERDGGEHDAYVEGLMATWSGRSHLDEAFFNRLEEAVAKRRRKVAGA